MAAPFIVDGDKRKPRRPGRWIVDYRNPEGQRRWKTFKKTEAGRAAAEKYRDEMAQRLRGFGKDEAEDFDATFADYATRRWLPEVKVTAKKPRTYESYVDMVRVHLTPAFGKLRVRELTRRGIRAFPCRQTESATETARTQHGSCDLRHAAEAPERGRQ